ncbi:MAG: hypothetical protein MK212_19090 [Saprospiraceae bacterium]|nr:hypothetical protein [Saprospiraceae bacterium]
MKYRIIIIALLVLPFFSCENSLEICFTNQTGTDFDSLWIDGRFIGKLSDQGSTTYIKFDSCLA